MRAEKEEHFESFSSSSWMDRGLLGVGYSMEISVRWCSRIRIVGKLDLKSASRQAEGAAGPNPGNWISGDSVEETVRVSAWVWPQDPRQTRVWIRPTNRGGRRWFSQRELRTERVCCCPGGGDGRREFRRCSQWTARVGRGFAGTPDCSLGLEAVAEVVADVRKPIRISLQSESALT